MRMPFRGRAQMGPPPSSPEALYRDLPRRPDAKPGLLVHQGDLLRAYAAKHGDTRDLALELPTGTGKTLPGLLIADWVRRVRSARVAYVCPTAQLAWQVADMARPEGVPTVVLVRSHHGWSFDDRARYEAAEAVAIVTYSTVFNSSPKLAQADLLIFDDAQAAEQYVAEQYAVDIRRAREPETYDEILTALSPALDAMLVQRLRYPKPEPGAHQQARLVVPLRQQGMVANLDAILADLPAPYCFRYSMIREALSACLVYLSYHGVLIRPLIPPTGENWLFTGARQRLYLSATLGDGGELERAFGRTGIARLALPATTPAPRSGRRFFVFPELVKGCNPDALAAAIVAEAGKALVLAPDTETAVRRATELAQPGWQVMTIDDVGDGMEPFAAAVNATCGLASRYDGLDLPNEDCRAVVLEGKPDQDNLQERFLFERVKAGAAIAERIRTRVVQGAGRCTRGPNDWAVVIVLGAELTTYLLRPETQQALEPELQAEVQFGFENSRGQQPAEVLANVKVFLGQGDRWRAEAEPLLAEYRHSANRVPPDGTGALRRSVSYEVEACSAAAAGCWADAARAGQDAARELGTGQEATRPYRSFWLYLTGIWADQAAESTGTDAMHHTARTLIEQAGQAAHPRAWVREMAQLPSAGHEQLTPADAVAVATIASRIEAGITKPRHDRVAAGMIQGLGETEPSKYEPALTTLGTLLGADAAKPAGNGRCDSAWCWQNALWIAVEAKSDEHPSGLIPHRDIRQANDQLRLLAADRQQPAPPTDSATVIASPRLGVDSDGVLSAEPHVHMVSLVTMSHLGSDVAKAWDEILATRAGHSGSALRDLVATALARCFVLPSQVLDRLTLQPVSAGSS